MTRFAIVVGGSHHGKSATRLCIQVYYGMLNPDCSQMVMAPETPDEMDIDIVNMDLPAELAITEDATSHKFTTQ